MNPTRVLQAVAALLIVGSGVMAAPSADAARGPVTTLTGVTRCTGVDTWTVDWTYRVKAPRSITTRRSVAAMHSDGTDRRALQVARAGSWVARWSTPGQNWASVRTRFAGGLVDDEYRGVAPGDCGGPVTGAPVPPPVIGGGATSAPIPPAIIAPVTGAPVPCAIVLDPAACQPTPPPAVG